MTKTFDTLIERLLTELMPAELQMGAGDLASTVTDKVSNLPGKSQHFSPLQKLDPEIRQQIVQKIISKVFPENENTYSPDIDNKDDLKNAVSSAIKEVSDENPEFKAQSKWAIKFLTDRLVNKELFGNVEYTTADGGAAKKQKVTQKEVRQALNKALEVKSDDSADGNVIYRKAADCTSEEAGIQKAFAKLPDDKDFKWSELVSQVGEEKAAELKRCGAVIEIVGAEEESETDEVPALEFDDEFGDDKDIASKFDRIIDPYFSRTESPYSKMDY